MIALRLSVCALLVSLLAGGFLIGGDDKKDDKKDDPKDPPGKAKGTLPKDYKKLGLDDKQTQEIYRIQTDYRGRIDALQQKINDLKKDEKSDIEKVLTKAQKDRLREIQSKDAPAKDAPPPAKDAPAKDAPPAKDK